MNYDTSKIIGSAVTATAFALVATYYWYRSSSAQESDTSVLEAGMVERYAHGIASNISAENFEDYMRDIWADNRTDIESRFAEQPNNLKAMYEHNDKLLNDALAGFRKCA